MKAARTRAMHRKHAGTSKHHAKAKHTPTAHKGAASGHAQQSHRVKLTHKAARARALSPGDVSSCSALAVAESLRLAVAPADVLALYRHTTDCADAGASIWRTLEAAYAFGLGGVRPVSFGPVDPDDPAAVILGLALPEGRHTVTLGPGGDVWSWGDAWSLGEDAVIEEAWAVTWP